MPQKGRLKDFVGTSSLVASLNETLFISALAADKRRQRRHQTQGEQRG